MEDLVQEFVAVAPESVATSSDIPESKLKGTTPIPNEVYKWLPQLLKQGCDSFDDPHQKDVFLLSALGTLSSCFDTVTGEYDGQTVHANMFVWIIAPPASGKGAMVWAQRLVTPLHHHIMRQASIEVVDNQPEVVPVPVAFDFDSSRSNDERKGFPKMLIIPANISSAALLQHLKSNGGKGLMIENEADTLASALEKDFGGFSDVLRKSFHHETVTSSRKGNFEHIEIDNPRLSMILTSTPDQVRGILPSEKNGLASRFLFHCFKTPPIWRSPSPLGLRVKKDELFASLGKDLLNFVQDINDRPLEFSMSEPLWRLFDRSQEKLLAKAITFVGEDAASLVYRLGLIKYRIAMILSTLRLMEAKTEQDQVICSPNELMTACQLIDFSYEKSVSVYKSLSGNKLIGADKSKGAFYEALPLNEDFGRTDALRVGKTLGHCEKTVDNYLKEMSVNGLLIKEKHNHYRKK